MMMVFTGVVTFLALVFIGVIVHILQKRKSFGGRIYIGIVAVLIISILLHVLLLSVLWHSGLLETLNTVLKNTLICILGKSGQNDEMVKRFSSIYEHIDLMSLAMSVFGIGFIVLSMATTRQRSELNPYELMDYFPVSLYTYILVGLLVDIAYTSEVQMRALLALLTVVLTGLCIAVPVYLYLCHTVEHLSGIMSSMLLNVTEKELRRRKSSCRIPHEIYVKSIEHVFSWQNTLLQEDKNIMLDMRARCHARAFQKFWDKYEGSQGGTDNEELAFALGYYTLFPILDIKEEIRRKYFHHFVNAFLHVSDNVEIDLNKYRRVFISGLLVDRLQQLCDIGEDESINHSVGQILTKHLDTWNMDCSIVLGDNWQLNYTYYEPTYCLLGILVYFATYMETDNLRRIWAAKDLYISADGIRRIPHDEFIVIISKFLATFEYEDKLKLGPTKVPETIGQRIRDTIKDCMDNREIGGLGYDLPC